MGQFDIKIQSVCYQSFYPEIKYIADKTQSYAESSQSSFTSLLPPKCKEILKGDGK